MDERRRSFRIRILLGRDVALLRVGREDVEVQLQNESSCGFGVVCPPDLRFAVGDVLNLKTVAGWFEVKATRVDTSAEGIVLGLDRVREVGNLDRRRRWIPWLGIVAAVGLGILAVPAVTIVTGYCRPAKPPVVARPSSPPTAPEVAIPGQRP